MTHWSRWTRAWCSNFLEPSALQTTIRVWLRYILDALHELVDLELDADLWSAVYPADWETMWAAEERTAATAQLLDDMRQLCKVNELATMMPGYHALYLCMVCLKPSYWHCFWIIADPKPYVFRDGPEVIDLEVTEDPAHSNRVVKQQCSNLNAGPERICRKLAGAGCEESGCGVEARSSVDQYACGSDRVKSSTSSHKRSRIPLQGTCIGQCAFEYG